MDKKSVLQIPNLPNDEIQGKTKNLAWCDPEQKRLCIAVQETYEFAEADAASRTFPKAKFSMISILVCGKHDSFLVPPDQNDRELKNYWNACGVFPSHFECFPSMQIVPNPDPDTDQYEIEVGRLIPLSGGNVDFPLGEGLLHFLYTDFETACDPEQITFEQEQEMRPASFESETEQKVLITCALPKQLSIFAL